MPSAALRLEIEHALERRFPAALTPVPRTISETVTIGISEVDALLDGGLPVGTISEVTGLHSRFLPNIREMAESASGWMPIWVAPSSAFLY